MNLTLDEVLKIEPDFQLVIDYVETENKNNPDKPYYLVWESVKKLIIRKQIIGFDAKHQELCSHTAYEWMANFVENLSKHK